MEARSCFLTPVQEGLLLMGAAGGEADEPALLDLQLIESPHGVAIEDAPEPQATQLGGQPIDDALSIVGDGSRPVLIKDEHKRVGDRRDLEDGL